MARIRYWVWLSCLQGLRPRMKYHLLETLGGPDRIFHASESDLARFSDLRPKETELLLDHNMGRADMALSVCGEKGISILTLQDAQYPERLRHIPDPPTVLYIWGRLPAVDEYRTIAVVGTRKPSPYGCRVAAALGRELTEGGALVVSGLAEGCDGIAMDAALRAGGDTIGVLGTAIDAVYPAKNRWLFEQVKTHGALVSEYPPGVPGYPSNFKARNRIISGLSLGVVVAEAPVRSGTRVTVDHALEQGRDVFAVPGNTDAAASAGCNDLIARGAMLVTCGEDILASYADRTDLSFYRETAVHESPEPLDTDPTPIKKEIDNLGDIVYIDLTEEEKKLPEDQQAVLLAMSKPGMHADELIEETGLPAPKVLAALTMLQMRGFVSQNGRRYSRKNNIQRGF